MFKFEREKCDTETEGTIIDEYWAGGDDITMIVVSYTVEGQEYQIKESVKLKSKAIKIGFLPIGQERYPAMGEIKKGTVVKVKYDSSDPARAYLVDNVGIMNR